MKTSVFFLFSLFFFISFVSCNNDDDRQPQPEYNPIVGEWSMIKKEGDWDPTTFNEGEVIWTFSDQNEVLIEINIDAEEYIIQSMLFPFHIPGTYGYSINENEIHFDLGYVQDEGYTTYPFEITNDTLVIGEIMQSPSDGGGIKMTLIRN